MALQRDRAFRNTTQSPKAQTLQGMGQPVRGHPFIQQESWGSNPPPLRDPRPLGHEFWGSHPGSGDPGTGTIPEMQIPLLQLPRDPRAGKAPPQGTMGGRARGKEPGVS